MSLTLALIQCFSSTSTSSHRHRHRHLSFLLNPLPDSPITIYTRSHVQPEEAWTVPTRLFWPPAFNGPGPRHWPAILTAFCFVSLQKTQTKGIKMISSLSPSVVCDSFFEPIFSFVEFLCRTRFQSSSSLRGNMEEYLLFMKTFRTQMNGFSLPLSPSELNFRIVYT